MPGLILCSIATNGQCISGFHLEGGGGGEASPPPPNCPTSPPKEKEKEREKGERERERGRGRERERGKWERGGGSIYLGIMIILYVSNISLIITNIKLMYKNTLCNTSWEATVRESATPPSTPNKIFWMKPCISTAFSSNVPYNN